MDRLFINLLNMSITASWLVLAVVAIRFLLKKAPKWINTVLWAFVGLRLVCPFSFESIFSLIPSTDTIPQDIIYSDSPAIHSGIPAINSTINPIIAIWDLAKPMRQEENRVSLDRNSIAVRNKAKRTLDSLLFNSGYCFIVLPPLSVFEWHHTNAAHLWAQRYHRID